MSEKLSAIGDTEVAAVQASSMEHPYRINLLSLFLKLLCVSEEASEPYGRKSGILGPSWL